MVFTDPPYNVAIEGNVSGLGKIRHREFAMASGEMTRDQFTSFLSSAFANLAPHSSDGSIHFVCMDWRHMGEMLEAGAANYSELKNLIVWVKDNGGMGSFYRSRHELIFAFKNGSLPHINSFELGQHGRYRTNVWQYRSVNTLKAGRLDELAMHPTVKPVAMIADAIKDVSRRGGVVLDLFGGSGSTLIAAHKTGRRARVCEFDPVYCDRILQRWEIFAKDDAELVACGLSGRPANDQRVDNRAIEEQVSEGAFGKIPIAAERKSGVRSPTHRSEPYSDCGEFDDGEIIGVVFFVAGRHRAEMFEFVEEAFDETSEAIEIGAEGGDVHPIGHWLDVAPGALACEAFPQSVAVVAAVGQEDLTFAEAAQHVGGASSVVSLAWRQLQKNGQAVGVDEGMDFRGQSASRAPHAAGSSDVPSGGWRFFRPPFLPFAPCWWTRIEELSIICKSPSQALEIASNTRSQTPILAQRTKRL